jgi:undecaprenyl-diphosphatase
MSPWEAFLLGAVEGLTEYLPISSTGHLILVGAALGHTGEAAKSFEIVIQLGAILAVLVHYRKLLGARLAGLFRGQADARRLLLALIIGFVPVAVLGVLARKPIKAHLFGPIPVAGALIVGGVIMIAVELWRSRARTTGADGIDAVTPGRALVIGLFQCLSLWPGASRAMCTILGGQLAGLSTATAAEFSFLLALPTLGAATVYELYKSRKELLGGEGANIGGLELAIGMGVSFVVAFAVIAVFLRYLKRRGLLPFGAYRVILGAIVLWVVSR